METTKTKFHQAFQMRKKKELKKNIFFDFLGAFVVILLMLPSKKAKAKVGQQPNIQIE